MALPTLSKTWQHSVNNTISATGTYSTTCRNAMFSIKNALVTFATNPWTVVNSTAGTGGAPAGTDTWLANTNLIGNTAGSNHSWIRLRQTGIATNFELVIDCTSSNFSQGTIVISPSAGFVTGGTATNRPTASDEIVLISNSTWMSTSTGTDANIITNIQQSTDGQCTRVICCAGNSTTVFYMFDKPNASVTGWTNPSVSGAFASASEGSVITQTTLSGASYFFRGRGSGTFNLTFCSEGITSSLLTTALSSLNDFDSTIPFFPIGIASVTASHRGRHGSIYDMWYGLATPGVTGDTFPADLTRTFALFGDVIVPWNGTTPVVA
jgi:hypothetical protein